VPDADPKPPVLLYLAAEGLLPVLAGCAGAAAGGPLGGVAGVAVGHAVERAINLFGRGIVDRWREWFAAHPGEANAAVAGLAAVPPAEARSAARSILLDLAPDASPEDVALAVEFLTAIPPAVDQALLPDASGGRSVPPTVAFDDSRSLLQLLPEDVPPYPSESLLGGTPYRLRELLGAGGFGAVYRAESPSLQHLPLAIKFCLDRSLLPALNQERSNLERLMRAAGRGAAHVVRLYGYDLDHATPYLVYEYVPGGDLTKLLATRCAALGRPPSPAEVFSWVAQVTEGLAFAHAAGLVHRDLKPANVLVDAECGALGSAERGVRSAESKTTDGSGLGTSDSALRAPHSALPSPPHSVLLKLGDFGLGGVAAARAAVRSRIGTSTIDFLSLADQASLFRGAGTPLYMSPEQRRGAAPDPRHDLYALGVLWFQLLVGDVSRELPHGWAKELTVRYGVPADHVALIERCVGWVEERPKDARELLPLLRAVAGSPATAVEPPPLPPAARPDAPTATAAAQVTPSPVRDGRRRGLAAALARLCQAYDEADEMGRWTYGTTARWGLLVATAAGVAAGAALESVERGLFAVGLPIGAVVWVVYVYLIRVGVKAVAADLQKNAEALAEEVAADFAAEVAEWGGRAPLRHPPTVRRLRAELDPPPPPAASAPASSTAGLTAVELAADPTRKTLLLARLEHVQRVRKDTTEAKEMTWVAFVLLNLLVVVPLSGGVYALFHEPLSTNRSFAMLAAVAGGGGGVWLVWRGMAAVRSAQDRKWRTVAAQFVADYPLLLESWGGRLMLESEESVAAVMRLLDPNAGRGRAGLFRRLFGG
jgi:serine/threonine protein kinase